MFIILNYNRNTGTINLEDKVDRNTKKQMQTMAKNTTLIHCQNIFRMYLLVCVISLILVMSHVARILCII